jgi:hypothetical protein
MPTNGLTKSLPIIKHQRFIRLIRVGPKHAENSKDLITDDQRIQELEDSDQEE